MNPYRNLSARPYLKRNGCYFRIDMLPLAEPICPYFIVSVYVATFPPIRPGHISMYKR